MKKSNVKSMLEKAEFEHRCFHPISNSQRQCAYRYTRAGSLVRVFSGLYARTEYWQNLYTAEQIRHIAFSLMDIHPDWKFTGVTAAALIGYDVVNDYDHITYDYKTDNKTYKNRDCAKMLQSQSTPIYVRTMTRKSANDNPLLRRINATGREMDGTSDDVRIVRVREGSGGRFVALPHLSDNIDYEVRSHIVDKSTMLFDVANSVNFRLALSIFDSAARDNVDFAKVISICESRYSTLDVNNYKSVAATTTSDLFENTFFGRCCETRVDKFLSLRRLCYFASGLSENGGESFARGTMIALGFMVPELQREFILPHSGGKYRCDFLWRLPNSELIVGEFDGHSKYYVDSDNFMHTNVDFNSSFDNRILRKSYDPSVINRNIDRQAEREALLMKECGVSRIVRFTISDIVNPKRIESKLISAGIPRIIKMR